MGHVGVAPALVLGLDAPGGDACLDAGALVAPANRASDRKNGGGEEAK